MNKKFFSMLILALSFSAHAAEDAEADKKLGFEGRFQKRLTNIDFRLGMRHQQGLLSDADFLRFVAKERELRDAYAEAKKRGGISGPESRELLKEINALSDGIFFTVHSPAFFDSRVELIEKRIEADAKHGYLTAAEKAAQKAKLEAFKAAIAQKKENGLTLQERKELQKMQRELGLALREDEVDDEGIKKDYVDRTKDNIDERQRAEAGRIVACLAAGNITLDQVDVLEKQQQKIREQEQKYLKDKKLSKEETADLNQLLAQASNDIAIACRKETGKAGRDARSFDRLPGSQTANGVSAL